MMRGTLESSASRHTFNIHQAVTGMAGFSLQAMYAEPVPTALHM